MQQPQTEHGSTLPTVFSYGDQKLRTIIHEGQPWFHGRDILSSLGLSNTTRAVDKLDDDEKLKLPLVTSGQSRHVMFVNESGMYHLIFRSVKPEAQRFRKWVTSEVLPALRTKGTYTVRNLDAILDAMEIPPAVVHPSISPVQDIYAIMENRRGELAIQYRRAKQKADRIRRDIRAIDTQPRPCRKCGKVLPSRTALASHTNHCKS